jgi:Glycosyltransferase like family 2
MAPSTSGRISPSVSTEQDSQEGLGGPARRQAAAPGPSFGVIITNRDRAPPLHACLGSLAAQDTPPAWVLLSDLGSQQPHRAELTALADRYAVSYLRIDHDGAWNKSLAFNTAFRLALGSLPAVTHVIQLDADIILHPRMLSTAAAALSAVSSFCCVPRMGPPHLDPWTVPGDTAGYERMLVQCGPVLTWAIGVFMVLPCDWLAHQHGFDETFTGWGHEDTELWWRVQSSLPCSADTSGRLLIHQWHQQQPEAGKRGANWPRFIRRMANPSEVVNSSGWGSARITESVLRPGPVRMAVP